MATMKVITDGASDIPFEVARELEIEVVPLLVRIDDRLYRIGIDISEDQVYDQLFNSHERVEIVKPTATTLNNSIVACLDATITSFRSISANISALFSAKLWPDVHAYPLQVPGSR
jgi:fatty acid-binding protein DegV